MKLNDLAGGNWRSLSHDELYDGIIDALGGPSALAPFLPYPDAGGLLAAYRANNDFNDAPTVSRYVDIWDHAAGFHVAERPIQPPTYEPFDNPFQRFLRVQGVQLPSLSQCVCLLKRAALRLLADQGLIELPRAEDEAIIIQPYQDLLTAHGPLPKMRRRLEMLRNVDPDTMYVLMPFALDRPGGLSRQQSRLLLAALSEGPGKRPGIVSRFHEHLCLDNDIRPWIDSLRDGAAGAPPRKDRCP